jgi:hypothetical protein
MGGPSSCVTFRAVRSTALSGSEVARLACALRTFSRAAAAVGVAWVVFGGAALGLVRQGGLLPWDDDVDVAVFVRRDEEWDGLLREMRARGESCYHVNGAWTTRSWVHVASRDGVSGGNGTLLDVFRMRDDGAGGWEAANEEARGWWPADRFRDGGVIPDVPLLGVPVFLSRHVVPYLDAMYPGWRTVRRVISHNGSATEPDAEIAGDAVREYVEVPVFHRPRGAAYHEGGANVHSVLCAALQGQPKI